MNPSAILSILLALSVAGNAWQFHIHDKLVATAATAEQISRDTKAAADACSASVDNLATEGRKQREDTLAAIKAQQPAIESLRSAANLALLAKPINPKDLCSSLDTYLRAEIRKEHQP